MDRFQADEKVKIIHLLQDNLVSVWKTRLKSPESYLDLGLKSAEKIVFHSSTLKALWLLLRQQLNRFILHLLVDVWLDIAKILSVNWTSSRVFSDERSRKCDFHEKIL